MASRKPASSNKTLPSGNTAAESTGNPPMFALTILYHPDLDRIGERAMLPDLSAGKPVLLSRAEPDFTPPGSAGTPEPLAEDHVSRTPLRLVRTDGGVRLEKGGSSITVKLRGEAVQDSLPFTMAQLEKGVVLELAHRVVLLLHLSAANARAQRPPTVKALLGPGNHEIAGESDELYRALCNVCSVATHGEHVLLRGESGTGKELMALAIHRRSARSQGPFVAVNVAAIPPSLAIAELFGAEKGAFTGLGKRRAGYFEQADGGTLFLDEIGEAPAEIQATLLRALESGEIWPLGAQKARKVDVRVIAATDADLERKMADGSFRAPLFHRLAKLPIWIAPLRARRDDIGRLLKVFLQEAAKDNQEEHRLRPPVGEEKPWFPARLAARLCEYDWPGNVRQLRNVVHSLVLSSQGLPAVSEARLTELLLETRPARGISDTLPPSSPGAPASLPPSEKAAPAQPAASKRSTSTVTEEELEEALRACGGNIAQAAEKLRIASPLVHKLMRRYGLRRAGDLTREDIEEQARACGGDPDKMAEHFGVSPRALKRQMNALGMDYAKGVARPRTGRSTTQRSRQQKE